MRRVAPIPCPDSRYHLAPFGFSPVLSQSLSSILLIKYSSLSYLRRLPIERLKIDSSFVRDLSSDKGSLAIATGIIALGHGLELEVVAEGVETESQAALLAAKGCDYFQGFLFSEAVPPEKIGDFARQCCKAGWLGLARNAPEGVMDGYQDNALRRLGSGVGRVRARGRLRLEPNGQGQPSNPGFPISRRLSDELANRYTMVACELTENGIKYGEFGKGDEGVKVKIRLEDGNVFLEVSNPIGEGSRSYLSELDRTIQWVRGFQDPFEAYIERMRAISREPLETDRSGLGLVRITYEGRSVLDFYVAEDSTLSVSAVSEVGK